MKVEHITFGGNSVIRDTSEILPETIDQFSDFEKGSIVEPMPIKKTPFACRVTIESGIAAFDFYKNGDIVCTTLCCFNKADRHPVLLYANDLIKSLKGKAIVNPREDLFMITFIINPFVVFPSEIQTAGEIELYVYNAILRGLR